MTREAGFTIVELLAAMVAGSLLLVALSWSVGSLARELRSPSEGQGQQIADRAPAIAALIEQALPQEDGAAAVTAERERLIIDTRPPQALGATGPLRLTLSVRSQGNRQLLAAQFRPVEDSASLPAIANDEIILVEGYREIWFDFARGNDADGRASRLRRVTLNFRDEEGRVSRLSAIPRINSSGACRFDPISMTCRT